MSDFIHLYINSEGGDLQLPSSLYIFWGFETCNYIHLFVYSHGGDLKLPPSLYVLCGLETCNYFHPATTSLTLFTLWAGDHQLPPSLDLLWGCRSATSSISLCTLRVETCYLLHLFVYSEGWKPATTSCLYIF